MKFLKVCVLSVFFASAACSVQQQTVVPKAIVSTEASFDGNVQNSGDISYDSEGAIKTPYWLERYDGMLYKFGDRFTPPVKPGDRTGIVSVPPNYRVTAQVSARFTRMNQWRKAEVGK